MPPEVSDNSPETDDVIDTQVDQGDSQSDGVELSAEDTGGADAETLDYAREQGWVPRDEWHGNPREWTDAKSFADRSQGVNALLRKANANQRKKHDAEMAALRKDVDDFKKGALANAQRQLDAREAELRALRAQAITDADGAEVDRLERDLRKVADDRTELAAKAAPAAAPQIDPEQAAIAKAWVDERPWLQTDRRKARLVQLAGEEIRTDSPDLIGDTKAFLAEVDRRLKEDYPNLFGETARMRNSRVDTGTPARSTARAAAKEKTYADLPKEARDTCDRMLKSGLIKKKEDYVKNFDFAAAQ